MSKSQNRFEERITLYIKERACDFLVTTDKSPNNLLICHIMSILRHTSFRFGTSI